MKLRKMLCLALALMLLVPAAGNAELTLTTPAPTPAPAAPPALSAAPLLETPPIELPCAAAILVEPQSGQVLFAQNADTPRPVASVTKVMTILLALEALSQGRVSLEDKFSISQAAAGMGGSQVLLDVGEVQPFSVLLKSAIVGSANDASVAIAEALYGSESVFVERMNERARELGLTDTHFVNCTGLPAEGQQTTARDVAVMTMAMLSYPTYFDFSTVWLDEVDHGDGRITQLTNTNKLIRLYDGCDGGKTGSTNEAGYCISATAERGGMRLIAVVLGADTGSERFDIASEMLDYGFAHYRLYPVAQEGTKVRGELPVTGGDSAGVPLVLGGALTLLIQKGEEQGIQLVPDLPESVEAPIAAGQEVGGVEVVVDGRSVARIPVLAAREVTAKGLKNALSRVLRAWEL
ncbi:MAG TPA: D-alanyl-D-alanine carboxypeptidase [Candidatus Pullichristensenella excrementipullorum]|nr:D-alanyl-D-alanine carboxypeptidase [Candidatus Pullichristensenella excrementipullorum]